MFLSLGGANVASIAIINRPDFLIAVLFYCTMAASLIVSYRMAGEEFDRFRVSKAIPGSCGEALIAAIGLAAFFLLDAWSPDVSLIQISQNRLSVGLALAVSIVGYAAYANWCVFKKERSSENFDIAKYRRFRNAYCVYGIYGACVILGTMAALALLFLQYVHTAAQIENNARNILNGLREIAYQAPPEAIQASVETAYAKIIDTETEIAAMLRPFFALIAVTLGVIFVITKTPLRKALLDSSIRITKYAGITGFILMLALALFTYAFLYSGFHDDAAQLIMAIQAHMAKAPWEVQARLNEIAAELRSKNGFGGFVILVCTETGLSIVATLLYEWAHPYVLPEHQDTGWV